MFAQLTQSEEGGRRGVHAGNRFADCSMRAKLTAGGRTDAMHDLGGVEDSLSLGLELHHTQGLEKKVLSCPALHLSQNTEPADLQSFPKL